MSHGGNRIPDSYLKRFLPSQGKHDDLPWDIRVFLDNLGIAKSPTRK